MNREQFVGYVEKHRPYLLRFATARANSREDAEDIVQEAVGYLWRIAPGLRPNVDPKPLFRKVVCWAIGKHYRQKQKLEQVPLEDVVDRLITWDGIGRVEAGVDFATRVDAFRTARARGPG